VCVQILKAAIMTIEIFVTGGTFDKQYNELNGELLFRGTRLPEMLQQGRCRLDVEIRILMMVDSMCMTDADRNIVLENCKAAQGDKILIIHGTDRMVETARVLAGLIHDKTIVLSGALIPYMFSGSDSLFNLGSALAFVQTLPYGVWVCMNGKHFRWDNVRKNAGRGEFEEIR
jgi:L-asparaginase